MIELHETIIPKSELPEEMPSGLQAIYTFDAFGHGGEKLTEAKLKKLKKNIQETKHLSIYLCPTSDLETALEDEYFELEIDGDWIALQYVVHDSYPDRYYCSCFDPDYLDSDEDSPMILDDGQSIIPKKYTMHDPALAANCVEYYARTRQLYPGMAWLKVK